MLGIIFIQLKYRQSSDFVKFLDTHCSCSLSDAILCCIIVTAVQIINIWAADYNDFSNYPRSLRVRPGRNNSFATEILSVFFFHIVYPHRGGRRRGQRARPIDKMGHAAAEATFYRVNTIISSLPRDGKMSSRVFKVFRSPDDKILYNISIWSVVRGPIYYKRSFFVFFSYYYTPLQPSRPPQPH